MPLFRGRKIGLITYALLTISSFTYAFHFPFFFSLYGWKRIFLASFFPVLSFMKISTMIFSPTILYLISPHPFFLAPRFLLAQLTRSHNHLHLFQSGELACSYETSYAIGNGLLRFPFFRRSSTLMLEEFSNSLVFPLSLQIHMRTLFFILWHSGIRYVGNIQNKPKENSRVEKVVLVREARFIRSFHLNIFFQNRLLQHFLLFLYPPLDT